MEGPHRALVVDDHEDIAEMLAVLLQRSGYQVESALSALEALEKFKAADFFAVVVSDIGMPGMNGYELANEIRGLPGGNLTVLIACTGFSVYDDRARALEAGFDELLTKPVSPQTLIATIERLLRARTVRK